MARKSKIDWLKTALDSLTDKGLQGINIVHLAKKQGVTTGSFYWHFKDLEELNQEILNYWENELTDKPILETKQLDIDPNARILLLMETIVSLKAARTDHPISIWSNSDNKAKAVFKRVMRKRFKYAKWMFEQAGFPSDDAKLRGRFMVAYLMGETTIKLGDSSNWKAQIAQVHQFLTTKSV